MDTRLCYNGTDRMYEVRLGLRVLSSHPTKEQAELALLNGEAPKALELAQTLITAHPELAERGIKAVALVAQGAIQANGQPGRFEVRARSRRARRSYTTWTSMPRPARAQTGSIVHQSSTVVGCVNMCWQPSSCASWGRWPARRPPGWR